MGVLLPLGIPCFFIYTLLKHRNIINPPLLSILKDKDYIQAFALCGRVFRSPSGRTLDGKALLAAQKKAIQEWVVCNPGLREVLAGRDYSTQFERKRKQTGFAKAQEWIKQRARDSNLLAHRYKFLWGAYRPKYYWFEVFDMVSALSVPG
jgi:hypothetical protein